MIENTLLYIFMLVLFGSGLLVWPAFALLWRRTGCRAKALRWVFLSQLVCQGVVVVVIRLSSDVLWIIVLALVNIGFTPVALASAAYDYSKHDRGA